MIHAFLIGAAIAMFASAAAFSIGAIIATAWPARRKIIAALRGIK